MSSERTSPLSPLREILRNWPSLNLNEKMGVLLRCLAIVILVSVPIFLLVYKPTTVDRDPARFPDYLAQDWTGGRVVWTVIIALLPFFIVLVGFYSWRKICPLAFFGRMSEWVGWPDNRSTPNANLTRKRVPKWLTINYPYVTWGFLTLLLMIRILLINSNAIALATTFIGLCLLAALVSFVYTGKTWCNYICPVYTIERIYTDGDKPNYSSNSQCTKCTGCKTVPSGGLCPDINQENDYWQELKNRPRTWAFYSWPGVVFGFYIWYFLHKPYYWHDLNLSGVFRMRGNSIAVPAPHDEGTDWGYYLSGDWTRDPTPWKDWFTAGFGFKGMPAFIHNIPTIAAVPITLLICAAVSFGLFKLAEKVWLWFALRHGDEPSHALESIRHPLFCIAGFVGFVCFYNFAGAPTFRLLPYGIYGALQSGVNVFATLVLATRLRRSRQKQLQYDQARKWIKNWPVPEMKPPADLEEAYRLATDHLRSSEDKAKLFQVTIRNMIADNLITASEIDLLDRMASDLGISEIDHKKIVKQLSSQYPGLFTGSLNDGLRLIGYRGELERVVSENRGKLPEPVALSAMQSRYRIQPEEHEEVVNDLWNPDSARVEHLRSEVESLQSLALDVRLLEMYDSSSVAFLHHELERIMYEDLAHILEVADLFGEAGELIKLAPGIKQQDLAICDMASSLIMKNLPSSIAGEVASAVRPVSRSEMPTFGRNTLARILLKWSSNDDIYVQAASIYSLKAVRDTDPSTQDRVYSVASSRLKDTEPLLREAAISALAPNLTLEQWERAFSDPVTSIRRCAIPRVPWPITADIAPIIEAARSDIDDQVRLMAESLCNQSAPMTPGGQPLPLLTTLEKMFALRGVQMLSHLSSSALHHLAERTREEVFHPGNVLCHEGERGDSVYILIEGETEAVQIREGQERRLGISHVGECVGEMAILDPGPRMATVRALDMEVRALTVYGEDFRNLLNRDATISVGIIQLLIKQHRQTAKVS